jgi:hypothetical protein
MGERCGRAVQLFIMIGVVGGLVAGCSSDPGLSVEALAPSGDEGTTFLDEISTPAGIDDPGIIHVDDAEDLCQSVAAAESFDPSNEFVGESHEEVSGLFISFLEESTGPHIEELRRYGQNLGLTYSEALPNLAVYRTLDQDGHPLLQLQVAKSRDGSWRLIEIVVAAPCSLHLGGHS